ncbi:heme/hemin ABC transporter substrate-binding protein [Pacificibacter marinus]|uniref:Hemin-binding periplasmic protein HmuT n=1 Tax=Pacificibacter marinus TaxID=658057 RepID=A0A1Y5TCY2_9RHOB|nr:hemin ABC transporter substrate-binding protein [Pacificibacter marinus]SEL08021.1 iron complex transport system substrate-binding protein [Pacificibacter marinus]SLN57562.1 Hemin-binding periplasmic protein HmuT precursor [Pacificibacter marinus]
MKSVLFAVMLALPTWASADSYPNAQSIVSIGGPVTEIIFALGQGDRVVARDTTSVFPPEVNELPDVGYMRQLSSEGVLSVGPDLIVTRDTAGPPETLEQLRAASIPVVEVHDAYSKTAVLDAVDVIGTALGVQEAAQALHAQISAEFETLEQSVSQQKRAPRVLFVLSNQDGRLNVAGRGTGADGIITLAGAENVMGAAFEGYKIINNEALITAAPDVVLMMEGRADHAGKKDDILGLPALAFSPAAVNDSFVLIDSAALGFGPRTAQFANDLNRALNAATD